jgi:hypothetical protein
VPWPVYSTRFIAKYDSAGTTGYTVPAGHRAVIKRIDQVNSYGQTHVVQVFVSGLLVYDSPNLASVRFKSQEMFLPVYELEVIVLYLGGTQIAGIVSGFLFADQAGGAGDAHAEQLPVGSMDPPPPWGAY